MALPVVLGRIATSLGVRKTFSKKKPKVTKRQEDFLRRNLRKFGQGIKLDIKSNHKTISKNISRLERRMPPIFKRGMLQAGFHLIEIIRSKTKKGIDFRGSAFAPYSKGYLKQLQREGKSTKVDLFYSGRMLAALNPSGRTLRKTGKNKISVNFSNAQMRKRALFNQVLNEPKREFFGFNQRTESIIQKGFNKFMIRQLNAMRIRV